MATKYGPRKKHNAGTVRKSTNNTGGSRTRSTTTVKTGNFTRSRSVNRNGTVRQTTTHKSPAGFITRTVKTIGSAPSKPKAPKFIVPKLFKPPALKKLKSAKVNTSKAKSDSFSFFGGGSSKKERRSRRQEEEYEEYDEGGTWSWTAFFVLLPLLPIILPFKWFGVWGGWIVMFIYYYMIFE